MRGTWLPFRQASAIALCWQPASSQTLWHASLLIHLLITRRQPVSRGGSISLNSGLNSGSSCPISTLVMLELWEGAVRPSGPMDDALKAGWIPDGDTGSSRRPKECRPKDIVEGNVTEMGSSWSCTMASDRVLWLSTSSLASASLGKVETSPGILVVAVEKGAARDL